MRKRYMVWKDIHAFLRDYRSFMLLFITPILITILVGSLFMSSGAKDIPIIVCTERQNNIYNNTISLINNSEVFIINEKVGECKEYIEDRLGAGAVRAGIIVPEIEIGSTIEIYVDNTKPIGAYLHSYFNLISRDISNRLINAYISDALWSMESSDYEISQMESAINSFDSDMAKIQNEIADAKSYQSSLGIKINIMKGSADNIESEALTLRNNVNAMRVIASDLGYSEIVTNIDLVIPQINTIESEAESISASTTLSDSLQIDESLYVIDSSVTELRDGMKTIKSNINLIKAILSQIRTEIPEYSNPVKTQVIGFFGDKSYINFIFPSILIMIVMWMATFLSSINFIRQKSRGILRRIYVSPMSTRSITFEKIIANTIISLIPLPFILGISFFILGIEMSLMNAVFVFLASALSVVVFAIIGLIIGSFSKTETTAILGSLIVIIPLMFMSGAFYPVEAFPDTIKMFTEFLPINTGIRLVEGFLFYSFDWIEFMFLIYTIIFYVAALSGLCWFFMRRSLKA